MSIGLTAVVLRDALAMVLAAVVLFCLRLTGTATRKQEWPMNSMSLPMTEFAPGAGEGEAQLGMVLHPMWFNSRGGGIFVPDAAVPLFMVRTVRYTAVFIMVCIFQA